MNNYFTIIFFLSAYIIDAIIALLVIVIIVTTDDLSPIIGDADIDKGLLLFAFIFFTILQTAFSFLLVKIIRDIQAQTAVGLPPQNESNQISDAQAVAV